MQKEYKFFLKILIIPILSFLLLNLGVDKVTNIQDFIKGFVMAVLIIIMLWLVYSVIRTLYEKELDKDKNSSL